MPNLDYLKAYNIIGIIESLWMGGLVYQYSVLDDDKNHLRDLLHVPYRNDTLVLTYPLFQIEPKKSLFPMSKPL